MNLKNSQGYNLIELLMALALSLVFLGLMGSYYLTQQKGSAKVEALSRLEENALIAANILRDEIHSAGYIGCAKFTSDFPVKNLTAYKNFKPEKVLKIFHEQNSDRLHILKTVEGEAKKGDLVFISDCRAGVLARAPISSDKQILKVIDQDFYVANTGRKTLKGQPILALYKRDNLTHQVEPLADGIEKMLIKQNKNLLIINLLMRDELGNTKSLNIVSRISRAAT